MSNVQDMINRIKKSNMHANLGGEQLTKGKAFPNAQPHTGNNPIANFVDRITGTGTAARKAAAAKQLSKSTPSSSQKDGVGDVAAKVQQSSSGKQDVVTGSGGGSRGGGQDNTVDNSDNLGNLQKGIQGLGSTNSMSGAANGAIQAGLASGGNPFAMAGGAIMGVIQSRENRKKAEQMVEATKFMEKQKAEQRKQKAMSQLQGNIGEAFRGATKSVSF